jgi:hypothetical protein
VSTSPLEISINLTALQAAFFRRLQHQLDVVKILQVGCDQVTAQQVAAQSAFGAFIPARGAELKHEEAQIEAQEWLLKGFLRDAIEATGMFVDECLQVCEVFTLSAANSAKAGEVHRVLHELPRLNHKLHMPSKVEKLKKQFGIESRFTGSVLSLNKARACVVHRLGVVADRDVDESGLLKVTFQRAKFIARGEQTGQELLIDRAGTVLMEDSVLLLRFTEHERIFRIGERVRLDAHELYDIIVTLYLFGVTSAQAIEALGRSVGIQFQPPVDAPLF